MSRLRDELQRAQGEEIALRKEVLRLRDRSVVRRALVEAEQNLDKLRHSLAEEVSMVGKRTREVAAKDREIERLKAAVQREQVMRISAQRGLVAYMRERGLGDRIGYDPDQDASLAHLREEPTKAKR